MMTMKMTMLFREREEAAKPYHNLANRRHIGTSLAEWASPGYVYIGSFKKELENICLLIEGLLVLGL